ncbi:hypothetical protein BCR35DRAFT_353634 [Leucosporidium creatinivorum]|uniref:Membrane-associated, eicosanoid/glutathione metabolism protein n=1 Tax=Leucosporidium creatinivorum TaxID=106004 RepID=A0A1Y2EUS7_9BASI|nr:hypothetical protein BCR35DRAFT_353634 [Leucosporidium creatinivorum]
MSTTGLSLYAIPAGWIVAAAPHWYAGWLSKVSPDMKFFDNSAPREFLARVRAQEKQTPDVGKFLRAEAAQQNGYENLPLFAAALVVGELTELPGMTLFAGFYLGTRLLYNYIYIRSTTRRMGAFRSATYMVGLVSCLSIFVKAGNALNRARLLK